MLVSSRRLANLSFDFMNELVNAGHAADVIIGNLSRNSTSLHSFDSAATLSLCVTIGASSVPLESASLRLKAQDFTGVAGLLIYKDNAGNPGSMMRLIQECKLVSVDHFQTILLLQ